MIDYKEKKQMRFWQFIAIFVWMTLFSNALNPKHTGFKDEKEGSFMEGDWNSVKAAM